MFSSPQPLVPSAIATSANVVYIIIINPSYISYQRYPQNPWLYKSLKITSSAIPRRSASGVVPPSWRVRRLSPPPGNAQGTDWRSGVKHGWEIPKFQGAYNGKLMYMYGTIFVIMGKSVISWIIIVFPIRSFMHSFIHACMPLYILVHSLLRSFVHSIIQFNSSQVSSIQINSIFHSFSAIYSFQTLQFFPARQQVL